MAIRWTQCAHGRVRSKVLKKSNFLRVAGCVPGMGRAGQPVDGERVQAAAATTPAQGAKNISEKVLTLKKSVIRFRPNEAAPAQRKRVRHRDETYNASVARPHPHQEGRRQRFPQRNATPPSRHPRPDRRGCLSICRSLRFGEGFELIRFHAPGASAAACGSDSPGLCKKQLGIQRMYPSIVH